MDSLSYWQQLTPAVPVFALLWFAVGILVGRKMPQTGTAGKPKRSRRSSRGGREEGRGKRSGGRTRGGRESRSDRREPGGGSELYVGNLPYDASEKDVRRAFEKYGKVVSVRLIENRQSGKPKGFGFVEMADESTAEKAIQGMNGSSLQGRLLVVNSAKSKERN